MRRAVVALGVILLLAGCGDAAAPSPPAPLAPATTMAIALPEQPAPATLELKALAYQVIASGLNTPVFATAPPGDPSRVFVVEKAGVVRLIVDGELRLEPFLDLTPFVEADGPELGLTGLAFHPGFASNGRFFVMYTNRNEDSTVVELTAEPAAEQASEAQGRVVLLVEQPQEWHNGGHLAFDGDGYLWVSLGDGGGIGDRYGNGQRPDTLLGTLLRIDVNAAEPYAIPPGNPFVGGVGGAPEVWAYGLRNPYRFSIDPVERAVYIGDVGQFEWEEIDVVSLDQAGVNFGWPVREGPSCFEAEECPDDFVEPVAEYSHRAGCVVVAGPVYRGRALPELWGHHFYADYCLGKLFSHRVADGASRQETEWTDDVGRRGRITSVGSDGRGELLVAVEEGDVLRVVPVR